MHGSHRQPRPASEQVQDLHVYVIPPELWRQNLRSAANEVIADSISLGFLRLPPQTYLSEIRHEIVAQLGDDYLPKDYTFLKSVGRCLTQVKGRQERELKAKHFIPPYAYAPELFILDAHAESMRDSPSTIYPQSLNGTALPRTGSKSDSGYSRDPSDRGGNNRYPNSKYDVTPPVPSSNTPRHMQQSQYPASDNQAFDHQNAHLKSSYPTYSQPYSHDISALTNAHRNQVDDSHRPRYDQGDGTYRKYNDDSSGYRSMPSPTKVSESSPTRVRGGDNSRSPRPEERNSNGYAFPSHKPNHSSPQKLDRTDTEILSEPVTSRTEKHGYNDNVDNGRSPHRQAGSTERDGEGRRSHEREMMSATPTAGKQVNRSIDAGQSLHEDDNSPDGYEDDSMDPRRSVSGRELDNLSEERLALLRQLEKARDERLYSERKREDLVKKARAMQAKTNNRRNQAREVWKKRYYEAKKQTPALESDCQKVRTDLDTVHKKYLSALESSKSNVKQKENHQLDAAKLQYEVDELQRRADAAKMKLTAEMKLRNQAETELRALRAELTQKKMNMNLSRSQKMNSIGNSIGQSGASYAGRGQPIASK